MLNKELKDKIELILEEAKKQGPSFGSSEFQLKNFVLKKHTDSRVYRQTLLELDNKFLALQKSEIRRKKIRAELAILEKKLEAISDANERIIAECEIEDKELDLKHEEKLIVDAINECNLLYHCFESLPKFSKEEFEKQEDNYWKNKLLLDAQLNVAAHGRVDVGTAEALNQIGINPLEVQTKYLLEQDAFKDKIITHLLTKKEEEAVQND